MAENMAMARHPRKLGIDGLVSEIVKMATPGAVTLIAVAGPPGSGKSTLAATLCDHIGDMCCVIPMDGFHLDNVTLTTRGMLSSKGAPETFDLAGFGALIDGLKTGTVTRFPTFDRDMDSVVEDGGVLPDSALILLFEGNYLLFDEPGWSDLADRWDASVWIEVSPEVLEDRLTRRWLDQGMTREQAVARAHGNDLVNARRVTQKALPSTWVIGDRPED